MRSTAEFPKLTIIAIAVTGALTVAALAVMLRRKTER
jgi:hypothetical protein